MTELCQAQFKLRLAQPAVKGNHISTMLELKFVRMGRQANGKMGRQAKGQVDAGKIQIELGLALSLARLLG